MSVDTKPNPTLQSRELPSEQPELLIDTKALARILSCSERQIRRLHSGNKLPSPVRIGRCVRWRIKTIERWLDLGCPDAATFERLERRVGR